MKTNNQLTIFSTGVFLESVECIIDRQKQWRWVATGFEDENFLNGEAINPIEYANKKEKLTEIFKN